MIARPDSSPRFDLFFRNRVLLTRRLLALIGVVLVGAGALPAIAEGAEEGAEETVAEEIPMALVIHDLAAGEESAFLGTHWRCFTDQVMGGVSEADCSLIEIEGEICLRLTGHVSLENNGGFIQAALPLAPEGESFQAGSYTGLRLRVCSALPHEGYYLHVRSLDCRLPWQYYAAPLPATEAWSEIEIPFAEFTPAALQIPLAPARLVRVAIVAAKAEFDADLALARVEFYR